jgi:hypothetical protein
MSARDLYQDATAEWTEWGALRSLSGPARPFVEAEEAKARDTLARASRQAELVRFIAKNTVPRIEGTHLLTRAALESAISRGKQTDIDGPMCQPIAVEGPVSAK